MRTAVTLALLAACSRGTPPPTAAPAPPTVAPVATPAAPITARTNERRCLPLVSGCGCASVCALTMNLLPDGAHEVTHDLQDSRLDRATIERWCFDAAGHGSPAQGARAEQRQCLDVFFDGTACGGECIPRTDVLRCALVGTRCAPSR
jgi:hypothetical protein